MDEESVRRVVREEMLVARGRNSSNSLYTSTQRMIRDASASAINEASSIGFTPFQTSPAQSNSNAVASQSCVNRSPCPPGPTSAAAQFVNRSPVPAAQSSASRNSYDAIASTPTGGGRPLMKGKPYRLKPYKKIPQPPSTAKEKVKVLELILLDYYEDIKEKYKLDETNIVGTWMFDLVPNKPEIKIRQELQELFATKFPLITANDFEFMKFERNSVSAAPPLPIQNDWNTTRLKALVGQSKKLYCRLKCLPAYSLITAENNVESSAEDSVELLDRSQQQQDPPSTASSTCRTEINQSSSSSRHDGDVYNELLNSLLDQQKSSTQATPNFQSLDESLEYLESKLSEDCIRITVSKEYFFEDAMAFYKNSKFAAEKRLKVRYEDEPAVDTGGVARQFFSDLFDCFEQGGNGLPPLLVGKSDRKMPTYDAAIAGTDIMETFGKIMAHCITQTGFCVGNLSPAIYNYLVNGEISKAMGLLDVDDLDSQPMAKHFVEEICKEDGDLELIQSNDDFLNLLQECGLNVILSKANALNIAQNIMVHYVLVKRKVSLDEIRKGLDTLDVLPQIQAHSNLYSKIFTAQKEYTNDDVLNLIQFSGSEENAAYWRNFKDYIKQASFQRLQKFVKFVSGSYFLPRKKIDVNFADKDGFFGGTCSFKIECPKVENFGEFCDATNAIIEPCQKRFTSV